MDKKLDLSDPKYLHVLKCADCTRELIEHRSDASEKATGRAVANVRGFHADLTVALDLRSLLPGADFLATTHEGDPASYFYPLTVR